MHQGFLIYIFLHLSIFTATSITDSNQDVQLTPNPGPSDDLFLQIDHSFLIQNSENSQSFLQQTEENPLDRDEDEHKLPEDADEKGDSYTYGDNLYILATSFIEEEAGTGKVWVIPRNSDTETYELVGGLQEPVGICFDINNNFLYVVDAGIDNEDGYIYQYEISWNDSDEFTLSRNIYVIIYQGESPYDCKIDEYGNLYFVESAKDQINAISYLDLYAGTKNAHYTLYQKDDTHLKISAPCALDLYESEGIYFVNNEEFDSAGTVNYAPVNSDTINANEIDILVTYNVAPWGVTYTSNDNVYFSIDRGEVRGFDIDNPSEVYVKINELSEPRGLCSGDGNVYVSDHYEGKIIKLKDNDESETGTTIINIQGSYALFCVNEHSTMIVFAGLSIAYLLI